MFKISPQVVVSEIDLTTGIPGVSTSAAAIAGVFRWGPVGERVLVTSEPELAARFHKPTNLNAETWFTAANFLAYGNELNVSRASTGTSALAVFSGLTAPNANTQTVNNKTAYDSGAVTFSANVAYVAKYPGDLGNSLRLSVCDSVAAYSSNVALVANADIAGTSNVAYTVGSTTAAVVIGFTGSGTQSTANAQAYAVAAALQVGDNILVGNTSIGTQYVKIASLGAITGNSTTAAFNITLSEPYRLRSSWAANTVSRFWEFHNLVDAAPGTSDYVQHFGNTAAADELHAVIVDDGGAFTGVPGEVLEVYRGLSRATNAKTEVGEVNYYKTAINDRSRYLWWANDRTGAVSNTALNVTSASTTVPLNIRLANGTDGADEGTISLSNIAQAYDLFNDATAVDVSFILAGKARQADGATSINYMIDNISEGRKDCIVFASPPKETVVNNYGEEVIDLVAFANTLRPSSYAFLDSGYKKQYDKYNDVYRWIPLNGDIAGLAARTDHDRDAWWSFAGYNRGQIKNVTEIAYNPGTVAARDLLSKVSVNSVVSEKGNGTFLFDDRTLLKKNSAFRAINVRRLFIVLEKAIATDAKYMLFEFNDEFTRASFRNRVVPFLRDIMGRRGILDFQVVCDESNNTDEVIQSEQFVGDIYIKPARAIRGIQLNFVAVRGGVDFNEIVGQF
jgi:hypothetical protein